MSITAERYEGLKESRVRDERGRLVPGHAGLPGVGRPKRATETRYLLALSHELDLETWIKIVRRAIEDAVNGDAKARTWLSNYAIGKPGAEPTGRLDELADAAWVRDGVAVDNAGRSPEEKFLDNGKK